MHSFLFQPRKCTSCSGKSTSTRPTIPTITSPATVWEAPPSVHMLDFATMLAHLPKQSHDSGSVLGALSPPADGGVNKEPIEMSDFYTALDIGMRLDIFEGLSHADIVTPTLAAPPTPPKTETAIKMSSSPLMSPGLTVLLDNWPDSTDRQSPQAVTSNTTNQKDSPQPRVAPKFSKSVGMYSGFGVNSSTSAPQQTPHAAQRSHKSLNLLNAAPPTPQRTETTIKMASSPLTSPGVTVLLDNRSIPDILRLNLQKKLKAKKKELERLNLLLSQKGRAAVEASPRPDSIDRQSPHAVTSSTTNQKDARQLMAATKFSKTAGMYSGLGVNSSTSSTSASQQTPHTAQRGDKSLNLMYVAPPTPPRTETAIKMASSPLTSPGVTVLLDNHSTTDILRLKLQKKPKAKKEKLERLNLLLRQKGGAPAEARPRPDSTDRQSPQAVTSSTTNQTTNGFFSDLPSPASTVSHQSPDSTGLLEMLVGDQLDHWLNSTGGASSLLSSAPHFSLMCSDEDYLLEFISEMAAQQQAAFDLEFFS